MKQFDKADKEFKPVEPGGTFVNRTEERRFFFKAGMLAAADIAETYRALNLTRDIAEIIREAANGDI